MKNLLCVVAYRVPPKRVDHAAVAVRPVGDENGPWRRLGARRRAPLEMGWASARLFRFARPRGRRTHCVATDEGGYGPRDVWDLCTSLSAPREFTSPQDKDAYAFALFCFCRPSPDRRESPSGREGRQRGSEALKDAIRAQVGRSRPSMDSNTARAFASFCQRVENPIKADLRAYLECLRLSLTIPDVQVWKASRPTSRNTPTLPPSFYRRKRLNCRHGSLPGQTEGVHGPLP